jgi:hypothetical protein
MLAKGGAIQAALTVGQGDRAGLLAARVADQIRRRFIV